MRELVSSVANSQSFLGSLPDVVITLMFMASGAILLTTVAAVLALVGVYLERKISAHMQDRLGPMYVGGWHGWAQTIADAVKLLLKEDIVPKAADKKLHFLAPVIVFAASLAAFVVLPWGKNLIISDMNVGIFYIIAISSFVVVGIIIGGWASNNKWSLLGAMRSAAQIVSFEIPASLAVLVVIMAVGTMNLGEIVESQTGGIQNWLVWKFFPFNLIAFLIYFVASLAEANRAPFDIPEAESEIVAGFHTEYSGMKWAIFFLAEYANMFLIGVVGATLFLGGWSSPFGNFMNSGAFQVFWIFLKAFGLIFVQMWLRWTLPRVRVDQLMYTSWKVLTPFAFVAMVGVGFYMVM
ncbi:NADH-quinone oxidoreductase subunit NuoH [candidate division KSB1 bacterium]|nr:NADH-quinone oxidoreductase subunit NuoH [candidate division KSB1 bacterium]NIR73359.1 NADH-quinone oxidoreductase subunit NuoH [candidate division KSB1 bacterium]NIS25239.1 NADH-quinone oxidoreductase subunit NuoH [candidate division KSB1 bacterium]NIT72142.1 NADH-quinone oxidoreductase subunit NuoH [candidate division KSB1 bacterium]NIU25948.1 NADH-quinone oxidoreductase subunit NuoH [candidate division KSB1 bacterium]